MAGIERNTTEEKDTEVNTPGALGKAWERVTTREEFCRLFAGALTWQKKIWEPTVNLSTVTVTE